MPEYLCARSVPGLVLHGQTVIFYWVLSLILYAIMPHKSIAVWPCETMPGLTYYIDD